MNSDGTWHIRICMPFQYCNQISMQCAIGTRSPTSTVERFTVVEVKFSGSYVVVKPRMIN